MGLVLVSRRGCHLCAEAEAALSDLGVDFAIADVDADAELSRLYDFRVPVLLEDGRPVIEGRISPRELRARWGGGA